MNTTDGITYMYEIERQHHGHFFDRDAKRFFDSRMPEYGYRLGDKAYFITSEKFHGLYEPDGARLYTIRVMEWESGQILSDIGEFNVMTKSQAKTMLKKHLKSLGYTGVF